MSDYESVRLMMGGKPKPDLAAEIQQLRKEVERLRDGGCRFNCRTQRQNEQEIARLRALVDEYVREVEGLATKGQFLVDNWPTNLEDGGITFPDGDFWPATERICSCGTDCEPGPLHKINCPAFVPLQNRFAQCTAENERLRAALTEISQFEGLCLLGPPDGRYDQGSNAAYEQCVGIAKEALKAKDTDSDDPPPCPHGVADMNICQICDPAEWAKIQKPSAIPASHRPDCKAAVTWRDADCTCEAKLPEKDSES